MNKEPMLTNTYVGADGVTYVFEYHESDTLEHLPWEECKQAYGICFHHDKILVVNNVSNIGSYTPPGGSIEEGESPHHALVREVLEETNMKVVEYQPIGYQRVVDTTGKIPPYYQLRYFCIVESQGEFESDPAGDVTEVLEIDPVEYKAYFDWGDIGERIVERALELKKEYDTVQGI